MAVAAGVLFSTGGAAIKAIEMTSWQVASFRSLVGAIALYAMDPAVRRGWSWRTLPVALAYAGTLISFVAANKLTTSANAIFLQSTAPLFLLMLGPLLLREPVRKADLGILAALVVGLSFFFGGKEESQATAPNPASGNLIAVFAGVTYAFTLAGLRWQGRAGKRAGGAAVVAGNLAAFLLALGPALPVLSIRLIDAGMLIYLGVLQIALAYVCLTRALEHVPALEVSTFLLVEPALNPIFAWLAHGERPGKWAIVGGVVIIGATILNAWVHSRPAGGGSVLRRRAY
jgi:drug/metabolite transporter (DMT)-like permease